MPRLARTVFAGVPHHITLRGNRREDVFYVEEDYQIYLEWLNHYKWGQRTVVSNISENCALTPLSPCHHFLYPL